MPEGDLKHIKTAEREEEREERKIEMTGIKENNKQQQLVKRRPDLHSNWTTCGLTNKQSESFGKDSDFILTICYYGFYVGKIYSMSL